MNEDRAYAAAVRLLSVSDKTPAALIARLTEKGFDEGDAAEAAARLIREGYLNEERLAEKTVRKLFGQHYGREYISSYLAAKLFSEDALGYAEALMDGLDFDASAKQYREALMKSGKSKAQAMSALYRRGFTDI
ncbi:MAG: RecX family transcriptional regulator [Clostridia bacterium]|nr:RecX family transcriptional regulator [Clostridia bacterium]